MNSLSFSFNATTALPNQSYANKVSDSKAISLVGYKSESYELKNSIPDSSVILIADPLDRKDFFESEREYTQNHAVKPQIESSKQAESILNEINKLQDKINKTHPIINKSDWDFTLKDGKIEVTGSSMSASNKNWLEQQLNSNVVIAKNSKGFLDNCVSYYQYGSDDGKYIFAGSTDGYYDVKEQLNGNLQFKKLIASHHQENNRPGVTFLNYAINGVYKFLDRSYHFKAGSSPGFGSPVANNPAYSAFVWKSAS